MNRAFSLVELSIVLVILGLLTGGILTGQNLIRAAEMRSVATEFTSYQTAANTFRDKYFQLPGDMNNAEDFWGTMATGTCPNATAGTGTQTCNGDGDGLIDLPAAASQTGEVFMFWQHLANAGMIEGSFTGIAGGGGNHEAVLGTNTPRSKLGNAGWWSYGFANQGVASTSYFEGENGNSLFFGAATGGGNFTTGPVLTTEEAWNIDTKMDDGRPGLGKIRTFESNTNCHDQATSNSAIIKNAAVYQLDRTDQVCQLIFTNFAG